MSEEKNYYDFKNEKIQTLGNRVRVTLVFPPTKLDSGLLLLDAKDNDKAESPANRGIVESIGKDVTIDVKVGDVVIFDPRGLDMYVRSDFKNNADAYIIDKYIFAKVEFENQ